MPNPVTAPGIETLILLLRGQKVLLDSDLAELYGVKTKILNQAVKRNADRFPPDFMFQLDAEETQNLRSQIVTSSSNYGGRRSPPYAFTEHGVAMLASVLSSEQAIRVNIAIVRAFARLRKALVDQEGLRRQMEAIEEKYDRQFETVFDALDFLMDVREEKRERRMGLTKET